MSQTIYVPRTWGGTVIIQYTPAAPTSPITLQLIASFRSGVVSAAYRNGVSEATYRDGTLDAVYRTGNADATYRDGNATTNGR